MAFNILFVDQDNAGLSIMAEALLNGLGYHDLRGFSGGVAPGKSLDTQCLEALERQRINAQGLNPKPLDIYAMEGALPIDRIILLHNHVDGDKMGGSLANVSHERWYFGDPRASFDKPSERRALAREALGGLRSKLAQRVGFWRLQAHARFAAKQSAGLAVA